MADLGRNFLPVCLSVCLLWDAQVNESPEPGGPHKYCVWFHFLYALPWAQLSISGQFYCPQGGLAGSADPVHMLPICFGLSFIHPLKSRTGQRCSWWTTTMEKLKKKQKKNCLKRNCDCVRNYGIWLQLQTLFSISDILKYFSPNLKLGFLND